ncbi:MAG: hypothetical protein KF901_21475 [Myxococcales bacterium]|nr:hypothetical protein [Myxococcales bacterium]
MLEGPDERAIAAELALLGAPLDVDTLARLAGLTEAVVEELGVRPPLPVLAGLGEVLSSARPPRPRPALPEPMRTALRHLDDHVLSRVAADPRAVAIADALAALPSGSRPWALALVVAQMLSRAPRGPSGRLAGATPAEASLGRVLARPPAELAAVDAFAHAEGVAARVDELVHALRGAPAALTAADVAVVTHARALRGLGDRLALSQLALAADALEQRMPGRLRRRRPTGGAQRTRIEDESTYPIGGFSSMSTRGTLENLVTSELAIMEPDGSALRVELGFDLFDLRWAQGELLYYVRDEAVATRERRALVIALDASLSSARVKDAALPWQRVVLTMALVRVALTRVVGLLGEGELRLHLVIPDALAAERALLAISLRDLVERRVLELHVGDVAMGAELAAEEASRAETTFVRLVGDDDAADLELADGELRVGETPIMRWRALRETPAPARDALDAWAHAARALVEGAC